MVACHQPDIPQALNELCVELLRRDPAERPAEEEILARLADASVPCATRSDSASAAVAADVVFVGRENELSKFHDVYQQCIAGQTVCLLLGGQSGVGTTALIGRFLDELREDSEVVILTGKCYEHESAPYKALDSLVDALAKWLSAQGDAADVFVPRDAAALMDECANIRLGQISRNEEDRAKGEQAAAWLRDQKIVDVER